MASTPSIFISGRLRSVLVLPPPPSVAQPVKGRLCIWLSLFRHQLQLAVFGRLNFQILGRRVKGEATLSSFRENRVDSQPDRRLVDSGCPGGPGGSSERVTNILGQSCREAPQRSDLVGSGDESRFAVSLYR